MQFVCSLVRKRDLVLMVINTVAFGGRYIPSCSVTRRLHSAAMPRSSRLACRVPRPPRYITVIMTMSTKPRQGQQCRKYYQTEPIFPYRGCFSFFYYNGQLPSLYLTTRVVHPNLLSVQIQPFSVKNTVFILFTPPLFRHIVSLRTLQFS